MLSSKFYFFVKYILIVVLCVIAKAQTFAQGSYYGCYLSSTKSVYTYSPSEDTNYSGLSGVVGLSTNYCSWTPTTGSNCRVCLDGVRYYTNSKEFIECVNNRSATGVRNTFTMLRCPIDNYSSLAIFSLGVIGIFFIRNKEYRIS